MGKLDLTNLKVSDQFVMYLANKYIVKEQLDDFVDKIYLEYPFLDIHNYGYYYHLNIYLNNRRTVLLTKMSSDYKNKLEKSREWATIYLYETVLNNLFHELSHAKQDKQHNSIDTDSEIKKILGLSYALNDQLVKSRRLTITPLIPIEREAEINMSYIVQKILAKWKYGEVNKIKANYLKDYKCNNDIIISPIEQVLTRTNNQQYINYIKKLDLSNGDKIKYGLPIDLKTYQIVSNFETESNDILSIKKLIKKL